VAVTFVRTTKIFKKQFYYHAPTKIFPYLMNHQLNQALDENE
jgi:hypothetical protein